MTQKTKQLKQFLTFIILAGFLFGCNIEEDKPIIGHSGHPNIKVSEIPLATVLKDSRFNSGFNKIPRRKKGNTKNLDLASRSSMEDQFGFTITDQPVVVITENNVTSYTMHITRDGLVTNNVENLVLQVNAENKAKALILNYKSTTPIVSFKNYTGQKEISEVLFDDTSLQSKMMYICYSITYIICTNPQTATHTPLGAGCEAVPQVYSACGSFDDGSVDGSPFVFTPGTGPTGSSEENVNTTPTICSPCAPPGDAVNDPCETLTAAIKSPEVIEAIRILKTQTEMPIEGAFEIRRAINVNDTIVHSTHLAMGTNTGAAVPIGRTTQGQAHNHPKKGMAIPSWGDINWTLDCENDNNTTNDNTAFNIVVVKNPIHGGQPIVYAVTIANLATLQAQIDADFTLPGVLQEKTIEDKYKYLNGLQSEEFKNIAHNTALMEKKFLQYFSKYGIKLSKLDPDTNKWGELKLKNRHNPFNSNDNEVLPPIPCN